MSKTQEQERLAQAIKDAEARLRVFKNTLDTIEKEIELLTLLQKNIEENLGILKRRNVIALAAEYKKSKEDLSRTKDRLAKIRIDRENVSRASNEVEEFMRKSSNEYTKSLKGPSNIIPFGRKNGQS